MKFPLDTALRLRKEGKTNAQIANLLGYTENGVRYHMKKTEWARTPSRNGRLFPVDHAVRLYRDGKTLREIATTFGYTYEPTRQHLLKAGLELRPQGGAH